MKSEKLQDAIGMVGDDLIAEARRGRIFQRKSLIAATAAVLAIVISLSIVLGALYPQPPKIPKNALTIALPSPSDLNLSNLVAAPEYPVFVQYVEKRRDNQEQYHMWEAFQTDWDATYSLPEGSIDDLSNFFARSTAECMSGTGNQLYSPASMYISLAMLAECTDGNSRQEILNLLGASNMRKLRNQAKKIWLSSYNADGRNYCVFTNSIWLDNSLRYNAHTAKTLANFYYTSVFSGDLGTEDLNRQLHTWINAMTGNILENQTGNIEMDPNTAFALVATMNFRADWVEGFTKSKTATGTFHSSTGDMTVEFMRHEDASKDSLFYWSDQYGAVCRSLTDGNNMWLILPDEGYTPHSILQSSEYLSMVLHPDEWHNQKEVCLDLSVPKFDIESQSDLVDNLKKLGVNDIFDDAQSNFSHISPTASVAVQQMEQSLRVFIDEVGISGAAYAYTDGYLSMPSGEIVCLKLDRPFLFVITTKDGLPLFVGIVDEP